MRPFYFLSLLAALWIVLMPCWANALRIVDGMGVNNNCYVTIASALLNPPVGEVIEVRPDISSGAPYYTYHEHDLVITQSICLRTMGGLAPGAITIDAGGLGRVIHCNGISDVSIDGFTLSNGDARNLLQDPGLGGGLCVVNSPSFLVANCRLQYNVAHRGGGMSIQNCSPIITNCDFEDNISHYLTSVAASRKGGGLYCETASPQINLCNILNNLSDGWGAGLLCESNSHPVMRGSSIKYNTATIHGGGVAIFSGSSLTADVTTILNNIGAPGHDGYLPYSSPPNEVTLNYSTYNLTQWYFDGSANLHEDIDSNVPDLSKSYATYASYPQSVVLMTLLYGTGNILGQCSPDGKITLTMLNDAGAPVAGIPKEDMWLQTELDGWSPCHLTCPQSGFLASHADLDSDIAGETTFGDIAMTPPPFAAGGYSATGEMCIVMTPWGKVDGTGPSNDPPYSNLDIRFNSPDINGDHLVNNLDQGIFSTDYYSVYNFRSDLFYDGNINLNDITILFQGWGMTCP